MAQYKHGEMDISEQKKTFDSFVRWVARAAIAILIFLLLLGLING